MRRRRSQLSVTLFPFLSVLLCTLGSLILLLLVLDQKARQQRGEEIAQQQAQAAAAQAETARRAAELEARAAQQLAELNRQAQERLAVVRRQRDQLVDQARDLANQTTRQSIVEKKTEQELAALEQLLASERRTASDLQNALRDVRTETTPLKQRKAAAEAGLALLLDQVAALEQTVKKLQVAAQQPRPSVYSLVPYRGRLGTGRKPIYLECIGQQVWFRPDGANLFLTDLLEPDRLKKEIEARFQKLPAPSNDRPYVLLLIRPSGIPLYYGILRSLGDASIDLGYEFVDEDWTLDFSEPKPGELLADAAATDRAKLGGGGGWAPVGGTSSGGGRTGGPSPTQGNGRPGQPAMGVGSKPGGTIIGPPLVARAPAAAGTKQPTATETKTEKPGGEATGEKPAEAKKPPEDGEKRNGANGSDRPRPLAPTPIGGAAQRDLTILLECRGDGVVLHPEKTKIGTDELLKPENPLLTTLRTLVERRERAGGSAKPQLRIFIRPDGLRTYYRVAALVEALQLRTSTEIIRANTSIEALIP